MAGFAAARFHGCSHGFAADFISPVVAAVSEVFGGQAAGFIQDVDQDVCAVTGQALTGNRVLPQGLGKYFGSRFEGLGVGDGNTGSAGVVNDNSLNLLGTHYRTQSAASGAADVAFRVSKGNVRRGKLHLACGAYYSNRNFFAVLLHEDLNSLVVPHTDNFCGGFFNGCPVHGYFDYIVLVFCRYSFHNNCLDAHSGYLLGEGAAGVAFLDAACQRALGTY